MLDCVNANVMKSEHSCIVMFLFLLTHTHTKYELQSFAYLYKAKRACIGNKYTVAVRGAERAGMPTFHFSH